jgi:hypothetical protein
MLLRPVFDIDRLYGLEIRLGWLLADWPCDMVEFEVTVNLYLIKRIPLHLALLPKFFPRCIFFLV